MRIDENPATNHLAPAQNVFQVYISTPEGEDFSVNSVRPNTTVSELKHMIKCKMGDRFQIEKLVIAEQFKFQTIN